MKRIALIIALVAVAGSVALAAVAYALGVASYERYSGYFAPIWDQSGKTIYFVQRDTSGFIWGTGWEHFTPPASSYVTSDKFSLRHLNTQTGAIEVLQTWTGSPLVDRVTKHYRNRIFNTVSARLEPVDGGVEFVIKLQIPKVPRSETWTLSGTWSQDTPSPTTWEPKWHAVGGISDRVLAGGVEILTLRGREAFPAAIVAIDNNNNHKVLIHNRDFNRLYPDGVPAKAIADRSRRASIERIRTYKKVRAELIAKHKAAGMREGEAMLQATDDMEELGLISKSPRLVAELVETVPDDLKVFDIPADYFTVGLFSDIAAAIATPGQEIKTDTGSYLKYYDDDVGPRLKAWRNAGNDRFAVRSGGKSYVMTVRRFR